MPRLTSRRPRSIAASLRLHLTLALFTIDRDPQPIDDSSYFKDAIAIGSMTLGMFVGWWRVQVLRWCLVCLYLPPPLPLPNPPKLPLLDPPFAWRLAAKPLYTMAYPQHSAARDSPAPPQPLLSHPRDGLHLLIALCPIPSVIDLRSSAGIWERERERDWGSDSYLLL
ncbi:hypothetical protein DFH09DRAFT_1324713 [Mycena vulgaris]|nr:hypothetical protein DFH09DRAFT_1324713 [Mycena vulgaris]